MLDVTLVGGPMDEMEAAAALAAVTCLLEAEAVGVNERLPILRPAGWRDTAKLIAQGLIPTRVPVAPRWGSIERLRRAGRGGSGVVGQ